MKVKFVPQNIEVEATPNKTLLQIATENNIEIKSICKGVPSCAECRVYIKEGEQNLVPPGKPELSLIGTSYYIDGRRLSCQVHCFGDVTVDLTEQLERAENQTKKVRGFRSSKQVESKAVQDTMILNEKIEPEKHPQPHHHNHPHHGQGGEPSGEGKQQQPAPQQRQQQPRQQQQNRNQNQQQQRRPQGGGQQQGQGQQQQQQGGAQAQKQGGQQGQGGGGQNQNRNRRPRNNNNQGNQPAKQQNPQNKPPQKPE